MIVLHYLFREEEIPEEGGDEQVVVIEAGEKLPRKRGPGDASVRDSGKYPVQFAERGTTALENFWNLHDHVDGDVIGQLVIRNEEPEGNVDRGRETGGENVGREFRR